MLVEHFGWRDDPTQPMPLDELPPGRFEIVKDEDDKWREFMRDIWRGWD